MKPTHPLTLTRQLSCTLSQHFGCALTNVWRRGQLFSWSNWSISTTEWTSDYGSSTCSIWTSVTFSYRCMFMSIFLVIQNQQAKPGDKHRASQGPVFRLNSKRHENTIDKTTNQSVLYTISLRKGMINKHQHKDNEHWKEIEPHHIS